MGVLSLVVIVLGCVGFAAQKPPGEAPSLWDLIYQSLQLFVLESTVTPPTPWPLVAARYAAPLLAAYTAIKALTVLFADQVQALRLRFCRGHVVVCGLGRRGLRLANAFQEAGERVVVIEADAHNARVGALPEGVLRVAGDARRGEVLARAGAGRARLVLAVCGEDGVNAGVARQLDEMLRENPGPPVTCLTALDAPDLYALMRSQELRARAKGRLRLEFFNPAAAAAARLLNEVPLFGPLAGTDTPVPHVVLVGTGSVAQALLSRLAHRWAEQNETQAGRVRATLVAPAAAACLGRWQIRDPGLGVGCEIHALDATADSAAFEQADFWSGVSAVVVCLPNDAETLATGLRVARRLRQRAVPVAACLETEEGASALRELATSGLEEAGSLHLFGVLERTCTPELLPGGTHEILARGLHEDYVAGQRQAGVRIEQNPRLAPWEQLPAEAQESNRLEADFIALRLEAMDCEIVPLANPAAIEFTFSPEEVELLARREHERWLSERVGMGWRHGPERDDHRRLNPLLCPWERIPETAREENRAQARRLPALLARARFQIARRRESYLSVHSSPPHSRPSIS